MYAQQSLSLLRNSLRLAVEITQKHITFPCAQVYPADDVTASARVVSNQCHCFRINGYHFTDRELLNLFA